MLKHLLPGITGLVLLSSAGIASATDISGYCIPVSSDGSTATSNTMLPSNLNDVQITSAYNALVSGSDLLPGELSIDATNCAGVFLGNDSPVGGNTGIYDDGLLNGENQSADKDSNLTTDDEPTTPHLFDEGAFITSADWQDLEGDGTATDPGWLNLWKSDSGYAEFPTVPIDDFDINNYLNVSVNLTDGISGTWSLIYTDAQGLLDALAGTPFGASSFDHLAFSFKDDNEELIFYDFDFNIINEASGGLFEFVPHNLAGEFDVNWLYNPDGMVEDDDDGSMIWKKTEISHIALYVRDPADTNAIPEPAPLALLALGLIVLAVTRKCKA